MLIVGTNLEQLIEQYKIIDRSSYDVNSLVLTLDAEIKIPKPSEGLDITYGNEIPSASMIDQRMGQEGYLLRSRESILACSREIVRVPSGYFGLCQTKGSLARLFVSINCADGQIEAGYSGKITFEIVNLGPFNVRLAPGHKVGQLFIFKTSTKAVEPYSGRYQGANGPTVSLPER